MRPGLRCTAWRKAPKIVVVETNAKTFEYDNVEDGVTAIISSTDGRVFTYDGSSPLVIPRTLPDDFSLFPYDGVQDGVTFVGSSDGRLFPYEDSTGLTYFLDPDTDPGTGTPTDPVVVKIPIVLTIDTSLITVTEGCTALVLGTGQANEWQIVKPYGQVPESWYDGILTRQNISGTVMDLFPTSWWEDDIRSVHPLGWAYYSKRMQTPFYYAKNGAQPSGSISFLVGGGALSYPVPYHALDESEVASRDTLCLQGLRMAQAMRDLDGPGRLAMLSAESLMGYQKYWDPTPNIVSLRYGIALLPVFSEDSQIRITAFGTTLQFALATVTATQIKDALNAIPEVAAEGGIATLELDVMQDARRYVDYNWVGTYNNGSTGYFPNTRWYGRSIPAGYDLMLPYGGEPTGGDLSMKLRFTQG